MMGRISASLIAMSLFAGSALAADPKIEKAAELVAQNAFLLVGVSYLCSNAVGESHYHAARMMAENAIKDMGQSDDEPATGEKPWTMRRRKS